MDVAIEDSKYEVYKTRVLKVIADMVGGSIYDFNLSDHLIEDLQFDELDLIEMLMALEDEFDIPEIPDGEAATLTTVQRVVDYMAGYMKDQRALSHE